MSGSPAVRVAVVPRRRRGAAMILMRNHLAQVSLGYLGVLPFELQPLFKRRRCIRIGEQGRKTMVDNDPPKNERKIAAVVHRVRGLARKLINRRTLITAFQILYWIVKIARLIYRLKGDS